MALTRITYSVDQINDPLSIITPEVPGGGYFGWRLY